MLKNDMLCIPNIGAPRWDACGYRILLNVGKYAHPVRMFDHDILRLSYAWWMGFCGNVGAEEGKEFVE